MLDTYFHQGLNGDQIVGRLLSLLPSTDARFAVLPAHFLPSARVETDRALDMAFGELASAFPGCQCVLELCLAAVVNHASKLESPGFVGRGRLAELPLFNDRTLLKRSVRFSDTYVLLVIGRLL